MTPRTGERASLFFSTLFLIAAPAVLRAQSFDGAQAAAAALEQSIAEWSAREAKAAPSDKVAIQASNQVRALARTLLREGAKAQEAGAVSMLYGHTLAANLEPFDKLFAMAPEMRKMIQELDPEAPTAQAFLDSIDQFSRRARQVAENPSGVDAAAVDRMLRRTLGPLSAAQEILGRKPVVGTWLQPAAQRQGKAARPLESKALDALAERIQSAPLDEKTKTAMTAVHGKMQRGWSQVYLRPGIAHVHGLSVAALDAADLLAGSDWLGEQALESMRTLLHQGILRLHDPETRAAGAAQFRRLHDDLSVARRIKQLHEQGAAVEHPVSVFLAAQRLRAQNADDPGAQRLINYLDRLTGAMALLRRRAGDIEQLPQKLRSTASALRAEAQRLELDLLSGSESLPADTDRRIQIYERAVGRLDRLHRIPDWTRQLERLKPKPSGRIAGRLLELGEQLGDASARDAADAALADLQRGLEQFVPLAYEQPLRDDDKAVQRVTDDAHLLLVEQIDRLRQDWASAWASEGEPAEVEKKLQRMRRLLWSIRVAVVASNLPEAGARLNRWAAWQAPPEALAPASAALPKQVAEASRHAAIGNWESLDKLLDAIEAQAALPLLIARCDAELASALEALPEGLPGALGQCVFAPRVRSFAAEHRAALAAVSARLTEAHHARSSDSPDAPAAIAHTKRAAELARDVVEKLGE